jgi:hypothetical protein
MMISFAICPDCCIYSSFGKPRTYCRHHRYRPRKSELISDCGVALDQARNSYVVVSLSPLGRRSDGCGVHFGQGLTNRTTIDHEACAQALHTVGPSTQCQRRRRGRRCMKKLGGSSAASRTSVAVVPAPPSSGHNGRNHPHARHVRGAERDELKIDITRAAERGTPRPVPVCEANAKCGRSRSLSSRAFGSRLSTSSNCQGHKVGERRNDARLLRDQTTNHLVVPENEDFRTSQTRCSNSKQTGNVLHRYNVPGGWRVIAKRRPDWPAYHGKNPTPSPENPRTE